jgi:hypothetical protein
MTVTAWIITILVVSAGLALFGAASSDVGPLGSLGRRIFEIRTEPLASHAERVATQRRLEQTYRWLTAANADAATFLYSEVKAEFDATQAGIKNLDTKASSLVGIVTTGLGAIALLGDSSKLPARTPLLFIGLVLLALALFAAVLALPTRGLPVPRLSDYALLSTLAGKDNTARIQFELIEAWLQDTRRAEAIAGGKARLLLIAAFAIVLGVLSLTVNWAVGVKNSPPTQPAAVQILPLSPTPKGMP